MKKRIIGWMSVLSLGTCMISGTAGTANVWAAAESAGIVSEDIQVESEGRQVPATVVMPEGEGDFPVVVMNHGFGGERNEGKGFTGIAEALAEEGIATVRMDFAGCGDSEASFREFSLNANEADSLACLDYVLENYPVDKDRVGVLGYSMGGRVTLCINQGEENPFKAMALLAPAAGSGDTDFAAQAEEQLKEAQDNNGIQEMEWFGKTLEVSENHYQQLLDTMDIMANIKPVCDSIVIYGTEDVMVEPELCKETAEKLQAEAVEIEGADHGYGFYDDNQQVTDILQSSLIKFFSDKL